MRKENMSFDPDDPFADLDDSNKTPPPKPKVRGYKNSIQFRKSNDKSVAENRARSISIDNENAVVRVDMAMGIAPIARPLKKGVKRCLIDYKQSWKTGVIRFIGSELDDTDLGILLAIMFIAQKQKPETILGEAAGTLLPNCFEDSKENLATEKEVIIVKTSYSEIRELLGKKGDGGSNDRTIDDSLVRISTIVVHSRFDKKTSFSHLIQAGRGDDDRLTVALSFRLTKVLLGFEKTSYGAVDMEIFSGLSKGTAQILYVYLCSWYGVSIEQRPIGLGKLVQHVHGESILKMTPSQRKGRMHSVRKALAEISLKAKGTMSVKPDNKVKGQFIIQRCFSKISKTVSP